MEGNVGRVGPSPANRLPGFITWLCMLCVLTVPASAFQARVINFEPGGNSSRQSATLTIIGAVAQPGCYATSESKPTLAQLLERAGGTLPEAGKKVRIIRGGRAGLVVTIPEQLQLPLHLGDVVLVEAGGLAPARSVSNQEEQPGQQASHQVDNRVVRAAGYQARQIARRGHVVLLGVHEAPVVMPLWSAGLTKERLLTDYLHQDPAVAEQTRLLAGHYPTNRPGELRDGMVLGVPARLVNRELLPRLPEVIPVAAVQSETTPPPAATSPTPSQPFQPRSLPTENREQLPPGSPTPQPQSALPTVTPRTNSTPAQSTPVDSVPADAGSAQRGGLNLPEQGTELMLIPRKPSYREADSVLVDRQAEPLPGDQRLAQRDEQTSGTRPPSLRDILNGSPAVERTPTKPRSELPPAEASATDTTSLQETGEGTGSGQSPTTEQGETEVAAESSVPSDSVPPSAPSQPQQAESPGLTPFEAMFEQTWQEMAGHETTGRVSRTPTELATRTPADEEQKLEELLEERRGEILHLAQAHEVIPPPREVSANPRGSWLPYVAGGMVLAGMIFVVLSIVRNPSRRADFYSLTSTVTDRLQDWLAQSTERWGERQQHSSAATQRDHLPWQQPQSEVSEPKISKHSQTEVTQSTPVESVVAVQSGLMDEEFTTDSPFQPEAVQFAQAKTVGQMLEEIASSPTDSGSRKSERMADAPVKNSDEAGLLELPLIEERVDLPRELRFFGKPQQHYKFRVDASHSIPRPHIVPRTTAEQTNFDEIIDRCRQTPVAVGAGVSVKGAESALAESQQASTESQRTTADSPALPQSQFTDETPASKPFATGSAHPGGLFSAAYALKAAELRGEE